MYKLFLIMIGSLSFMIGVIGIFLPLVPTTPLVMLAAYCFARSSKRVHRYIVTSSVYRHYVSDFMETGTLSRSKKKSISIRIGLLMGISILLAPLIKIKISLVCLTVVILCYLFFGIKDQA